jgi:2-polyprenyl-6-methoxyphenol hydroxylase-like FAD-dependent oxidoreductase
MTIPAPHTTYDVLVVGAGPSGLATAIAATRAGARVLVVDRHDGTTIFPKATGVRPRTMEILRSWGLEERVPAGGADLRMAAAVSATLADRQQQHFSLGLPQPESVAVLSPSTAAISPQDHLEPLLLERLRSLGGQIRFGTGLVGLEQFDDRVSARLTAVGGRRSDRGSLRGGRRRRRQHGASHGGHRRAPTGLRGRAPGRALLRSGGGTDPG